MGESAQARGGSGQMFDAIAARYDLLNRVLSLGVDQGWRRKTVDALEIQPGYRLLDLATGTADLALQLAARYPDTSVVGLDPSSGMLEVGRRKVGAAGACARIQILRGSAETLPFQDGSFDGITMAFGIRNVPDRPQALREMARVLRPSGKLAILELSEPQGGAIGPLARFHIRTLVPRIGALLSGAREYRYLQQSIAAFPAPAEFGELMTRAGLAVSRIVPLTFGVSCLYVATRGGRP
jgi:demethylmenaquinone methyltransferase/2-methoxy-6-polyprenyl-1,4-benzoquinol methylase